MSQYPRSNGNGLGSFGGQFYQGNRNGGSSSRQFYQGNRHNNDGQLSS